MAQILGFRIQNYKVLKDVTFGKIGFGSIAQLTPMISIIGKNGTGKSTVIDALGFLADCVKNGVEEACDMRGRGGFERLRSQCIFDPIRFTIYYRDRSLSRPMTYELEVDVNLKTGQPFALSERLRQRRYGQKYGQPLAYLLLYKGNGFVWKGEEPEGREIPDSEDLLEMLKLISREKESTERETVQLEDKRKLGIATLGSLKQHPRISAFRQFIEGWYLSYFTPDAARSLPLAGPQRHLNVHGDNLGNVVQFMERENKDRFDQILKRIASKIPGIEHIDTKRTDDGRLLIRFNDRGFSDPFFAQQMSDGTLKVFAYLLLLEDPSPPPLICVEEPENGLYHKLLATLACEFREHAEQRTSQVIITTHQPHFVDALQPDEVWILEKGEDGFATARRASENPLISELVNEEIPLGSLWYSDYFEEK